MNLDSFLKSITYQKITAEGLRNLGPVIEEMANAEDWRPQQNSVSLRLKILDNE